MNITLQETAHVHHDLGGGGKGRSETLEHVFKNRNDENKDDRNDDDGNGHDHDRIGHGSLDLGFQSFRFLNELGQAAQDRIENTAHLPCGHEVHEKGIEDLGVLFHGFRQGGSSLHVLGDFLENRLEGGIFGLLRKNRES